MIESPYERPFVISAKAYSDGYVAQLDFDCVGWFIQALDDTIIDLHNENWGGGYVADSVAQYYDCVDTDMEEFFRFCRKLRCGFECEINKKEALAWLKDNRKNVYDKIKEKENG